MFDLAWAQEGASGGGGGMMGIVPLILMFVIFYFLLFRPQQKKQKQHKAMLAALKRGDQVVTQGGIHGKITGLTEAVATVEIAPGVRVRVSRGFISGLNTPQQQAPAEKS